MLQLRYSRAEDILRQHELVILTLQISRPEQNKYLPLNMHI